MKVDKGERTAAYIGRCRELFEKAAREGIELPDVARGYLMLRGARQERASPVSDEPDEEEETCLLPRDTPSSYRTMSCDW